LLGEASKGVAVDEITCNLRERRLLATGRNYLYAGFLCVNERIEYVQHPENPSWTLFKQSVECNVTSLFGPFTNALVQFGQKMYREKATIGVKAVQYVVDELSKR